MSVYAVVVCCLLFVVVRCRALMDLWYELFGIVVCCCLPFGMCRLLFACVGCYLSSLSTVVVRLCL